jgi:hypothetical protein
MFREISNIQKADGYKWSNTLETWKKRDFIYYNFKLYYFKPIDEDNATRYSQLRGIIDIIKSVDIFEDSTVDGRNKSYTIRIKNKYGIYNIIFYTKNEIIKAMTR